ncbi:MAG: bestrophin family ion channel [Bacteroidota bacterium]
MYIGKNLSIKTIWFFARRNLFITLIISVTATSLYFFLDWTFLAIPFLPVGTIGTAVAFYVGFKNNQAYDRLWEARRLWGGITNTSRSLAASVLSIIPDKNVQEDILYRHIAFINILRLQLRKTIVWATSNEHLHQSKLVQAAELEQYESAIVKLFGACNEGNLFQSIKHKSNIASETLRRQFEVITELKKAGQIDSLEHSDMLRLLGELYNLQGGCERIKNTPLFRQYSIFSRIFVKLFIMLLPFALLSSMKGLYHDSDWSVWLTIPFTLLISWVFFTMEQIGEFSENPFDNGINDTPISTICRNIEIELMEMMGETELPERIQPHKNILL